MFALRHELNLSDAGQWSAAKAAFEAHLASHRVLIDVLAAAAHASFSHGEIAIAAYLEHLDDEAPGEDEEDPEDTDMKDTNFVDDWRQSGRAM